MSKKIIWEYFKAKGFSDCGIAGLMGNIQAESNFKATNLQQTYEKSLKMSDEEYTKAVDNGTYTNFVKDSAGYGLAQWTYWSRKQSLLNYAKKCKKSIGDLQMQLDFMYSELKGYKEVLKTLQTAKTVREASDAVLLKYERPADQSEKARAKRASYGEAIYNEFCAPKTYATVEIPVLKKGAKGAPVGALQILLNGLGYSCGEVDGSFGNKTLAAVQKFQKDRGLAVDGSVGKATWTALLN